MNPATEKAALQSVQRMLEPELPEFTVVYQDAMFNTPQVIVERRSDDVRLSDTTRAANIFSNMNDHLLIQLRLAHPAHLSLDRWVAINLSDPDFISSAVREIKQWINDKYCIA